MAIYPNYPLFFTSGGTRKRRSAMMRANEIQQRLNHIESTIHQVAERCRSINTLPMDLKDSIQQLDQRAVQTHSMLERSQDENQMMQCVDDLEELGDRAKEACEHSSNVDRDLREAIMQAHRELSDLKHQLH
jgi:DNA-binding ferritin-like protein